jgi:integrase
MMTVYRHRDKWRYDFWKNNVRQRESGFLTKREAIAAEAEARKNLKEINSDFISLCESRLTDLEERRTPKYFAENKSLIEKLILVWGNKKVVSRKDVEDYLSSVASKSHFVANKGLRFIKALFNHGIERDLLSDNPAQKIKYFPVDKKKKYIPPLEDVNKVLAILLPKQKAYIAAIISTLARINEINKLKWEDISGDFLVLRTRKSKNSDLTERTIPINDTLKAVLKLMPKISEYVFCHPVNKKPYLYRSKFLKKACAKVGVKEFGYHALRHYGASKLSDSGVPLTDIQAILGHQRPTTTDIYLQSIRPSLKGAMKNLEIVTHPLVSPTEKKEASK